jgi:hypothetical protein
MRYLKQIKDLIPYKHYFLSDFWKICPYNLEDLTSSRQRKKLVYLHVGMVWARLSGMSTEKVGEYFNRDHSSVTHAEKAILEVLLNPKFGHKEYLENIDKIKRVYENSMLILNVEKTDDVYQDYYASLVNMENNWYYLRNTKIWKNS